jgi:hypothetical protein
VLVACEFSGVVRDAFLAGGHDAVSCDLAATERPGPHVVGDVRELLGGGWDLMIAFPPCTYLAYAGARWFAQRCVEQEAALAFVAELAAAPIARIAIENPRGVLSRRWRWPDQRVERWWFGDPFNKRTYLWLKGLAPLMATLIHPEPAEFVQSMPGSRDQARNRSRTFPGVAAAMAEQWGGSNG